jgi:hypothetical protein
MPFPNRQKDENLQKILAPSRPGAATCGNFQELFSTIQQTNRE